MENKIKLNMLNVELNNNENIENIENINYFESILYKLIENRLKLINIEYLKKYDIYFNKYRFKIRYNPYNKKIQFNDYNDLYLKNIRYIILKNIHNLNKFVENIFNIIDNYILKYFNTLYNLNCINIDLYNKL